MEESICPIVPLAAPSVLAKGGGDWKTLAICGGLVLLFCILSYFLYRFVQHTNKRIKSVEQALHNVHQKLTDREKARPVVQQPPPQQHYFMHQEPVVIPPPIFAPPPPPAAAPPAVVVDSKILDRELSEELKELDGSATEGRVEEKEKEVKEKEA